MYPKTYDMKTILIDTAKKYFEDNGIKFGETQFYRDVPKLSNNVIYEGYLDSKFMAKSVEFISFNHKPHVVLKGKEFKNNGEPRTHDSILFEFNLSTDNENF